LRLLDQEKRADLAKTLTPAELELYDLNLSRTANALRRQMGAFQPTEEEFRSLYQIRRTSDEKYSASLSDMSEAAMKDQFRAVLGDQRYAEFERAQDYGYRAASEIATHFNLPPASATETYAFQQSMNQRMQEARAAAGNDRAALAAASQALATEANAKLTALLGVPGLDAYKKTGGAWLRSLEKGTIPRPSGGAPGG